MTKINVKGLEKIAQASVDQKKAMYNVVISDKVEFKARSI